MAQQTVKVNVASFSKQVEKTFKGKDVLLVNLLTYIGETAVKIAREKGSYGDVTGNLRSSIGYAVFKDGRPLLNGQFEKFKDGSEGMTTGSTLLDKVASAHPDGYVLYLVAGMEYASYVEDIHGKDVLTSARLEAEALATRLLKKLNG